MSAIFPQVGNQSFVEREGVIHVSKQVNDARCIWRETHSTDVGIDGQIEYVNGRGQATGHMVFVQIKSGDSYFTNSSNSSVTYYPSEKHKSYWERSPLPVILIIHNEANRETIWVDARAALRSGLPNIQVPRTNIFDQVGVLNALSSAGSLPEEPMTMASLAVATIAHNSPSSDLPIDYLDLFLHGLMNFCNTVYFSIDLVTSLAESKLEYIGSEFDIGLGWQEYEFLREYVLFLTAQDLVRVDQDQFNREWDNQVVPIFMAPVTLRGKAFCQYLTNIDNSQGIRAVQDKTFRGIATSEIVRRVPVIEQLKTIISSTTTTPCA